MIIIPAVDIKDGKCVQMIGGKLGTEKFYGDPIEIALKWQSDGAKLIHIVDLDAAIGTGDNSEIVAEICRRIDIPVEFGGGIRDIDRVRKLINMGIDRIILGTFAIEDYMNNFLSMKKLKDIFGSERLMIAIDSRDGEIVVSGWQHKTGIKTTEFVGEVGDLIWGFLYTDVEVEGRMEGINLKRTREVVESTELPVIVSGGVSSKEDLRNLEEIGTWGVVIGKALYEGKLRFLKG